jgi:hypothetical protein
MKWNRHWFCSNRMRLYFLKGPPHYNRLQTLMVCCFLNRCQVPSPYTSNPSCRHIAPLIEQIAHSLPNIHPLHATEVIHQVQSLIKRTRAPSLLQLNQLHPQTIIVIGLRIDQIKDPQNHLSLLFRKGKREGGRWGCFWGVECVVLVQPNLDSVLVVDS